MRYAGIVLVFFVGSLFGFLVGKGMRQAGAEAGVAQGTEASSKQSSRSGPGPRAASRVVVEHLAGMSPSERLTAGLQMTSAEMKALSRQLEGKGHAGALPEMAAVVENLRPENVEGAISALQEFRDQGKHFGVAENAIWERIGEVDGERQLNNRIPELRTTRPVGA